MPEGDLDRILRALHVLLRQGRNPRLGEYVRTRAGVDTDRAVYYLLGRIRGLEPARLTDLAADLGVDVSTVSRQISHLEARSLVIRTRDPADGRASRLRLSPDGREVLRKLAGAWEGSVADILADWPAERVAGFADTLEDFADRLATLCET